MKPVTARYQPHGRRRPGDFDTLFFNTRPYLSVTNYDESGLSMPNSFHVMHRFGVTGDYVIRATPDNGSRPPGSEPLQMAVFVDGVQVGVVVDRRRARRTDAGVFRARHRGRTLDCGWVPEAVRRTARSLRREESFDASRARGRAAGAAAAREAAAAPAAPAAEAAAVRAAPTRQANNNNDDAASNGFFMPPGAPPGTRLARPDNMGVQSIEIGGPHNSEVRPSPESTRKLFMCGQRDAWLPPPHRRESRAPRIPPSGDAKPKSTQVMAHADRARKRGDPFEEQVVVAMQAMLVSPNFLFRIERDQPAREARRSRPRLVLSERLRTGVASLVLPVVQHAR